MNQPPPPRAWLLRLGTAGALLSMLAHGSRWWMLPLVLFLLVMGAGLLFVASFPYVAPFIYTAI